MILCHCVKRTIITWIYCRIMQIHCIHHPSVYLLSRVQGWVTGAVSTLQISICETAFIKLLIFGRADRWSADSLLWLRQMCEHLHWDLVASASKLEFSPISKRKACECSVFVKPLLVKIFSKVLRWFILLLSDASQSQQMSLRKSSQRTIHRSTKRLI